MMIANWDPRMIDGASLFVKTWLKSSRPAFGVLLELLTFDVLGINPAKEDAKRAEISDIWDAMYNKQTTVEGRENKQAVKQATKGFRRIEDKDVIKRALDWLQYIHHYDNDLSAWCRAQKIYISPASASRMFEPLERALRVRNFKPRQDDVS
jgi:hypothetical protein